MSNRTYRFTLLLMLFALICVAPGWSQSGAGGRGRSRGPVMFDVTVNANVSNAMIRIDGTDRGSVPQEFSLEAGEYTFNVRAPGHYEWSRSVTVSEDGTVVAQLEPLRATFEISIPQAILDRNVANAAQQIQVYVDGQAMSSRVFEVTPGRHTITVRTGGISTQTAINAQSGARYTITPFFGIETR